MELESKSDLERVGSGDRGRSRAKETLKVAVAGCSHGEMEQIYEALSRSEVQGNFKTDLLICCGDYQAVRNWTDLASMACPDKYKSLQTFYKYYSGQKTAPVLTIFIGGNHEASNYLLEFPYGGWVAPNIYYMGYADVLRFGGLRIAGFSGIYKKFDYYKGHFEHPPFSADTMRSVYHVRDFDLFRLRQMRDTKPPFDIVFSHDWPNGVHDFGDTDWLLNVKPHFQEDVRKGELGNPGGWKLLQELKPRFWFSAHLHVKFAAAVEHRDGRETKFLALDKPLPRRQFLQLLDIDASNPADKVLCYDADWLAVLRLTDHLLCTENRTCYMPGPSSSTNERYDFRPSDADVESVMASFNDDLRVPLNFAPTAVAHDHDDSVGAKAAKKRRPDCPEYYLNAQTELFCRKLGVTDVNRIFYEKYCAAVGLDGTPQQPTDNPDEIDLGDDEVQQQEGIGGGDLFSAFSEENSQPKLDFVPPKFLSPLTEQSSADLLIDRVGESSASSKEHVADAMLKFKRRNREQYEHEEEAGGNEESEHLTL